MEKNDISTHELNETEPLKGTTDQDQTESISQYKLSMRRWPLNIFYSTSVVGSALGMLGFSPITDVMQGIYGVSDFEVQLLMLVFVIFYIPLMFPANYLIEHKGISIPIILATILLIAGAWIRMFANYSFYFILVGQILMAMGQPFVVTAPPKIAGLWHSDNEQALGTTLGSLAQPIGAVLGFLLPLPFISDSDKDSPDGKSKMLFYILIQSIIITVISFPILLIVKDKPDTPPSRSAEEFLKIVPESQVKNFCKLMKNRDFLSILGAFSCIFCVYITLGATVGQITKEFEFGAHDNSYFGAVFAVAGILGSFIHAVPLDAYQKYKLQFIIIGITSVMGIVATTLGLYSQIFWVAALCMGFMGFVLLPIISVSYAFAAEVSFPVNEAHSCGFLQLIGSIIAVIISFVVGILLDSGYRYPALYFLIGVVCIGCICSFFARDNLRKTMSGRRNSSIKSASTISLKQGAGKDIDKLMLAAFNA
ncbi:unnamed protein product [Moneuplotes crassus]|uniref:Major facilitator superfamily (MFS) profile domain-containing protein n=3 Tax=Euplotes crassus TaxID=5936 RepID=A0AAD1UG08_EUPCR|nr:unnamed protein product [Moneuplotes crassus]